MLEDMRRVVSASIWQVFLINVDDMKSDDVVTVLIQMEVIPLMGVDIVVNSLGGVMFVRNISSRCIRMVRGGDHNVLLHPPSEYTLSSHQAHQIHDVLTMSIIFAD